MCCCHWVLVLVSHWISLGTCSLFYKWPSGNKSGCMNCCCISRWASRHLEALCKMSAPAYANIGTFLSSSESLRPEKFLKDQWGNTQPWTENLGLPEGSQNLHYIIQNLCRWGWTLSDCLIFPGGSNIQTVVFVLVRDYRPFKVFSFNVPLSEAFDESEEQNHESPLLLHFSIINQHRFLATTLESESESHSVVSDSLRPMDYTVHGILQARILNWVAYTFSSVSSRPRNRTGVSCTAGGFFTNWATKVWFNGSACKHQALKLPRGLQCPAQVDRKRQLSFAALGNGLLVRGRPPNSESS